MQNDRSNQKYRHKQRDLLINQTHNMFLTRWSCSLVSHIPAFLICNFDFGLIFDIASLNAPWNCCLPIEDLCLLIDYDLALRFSTVASDIKIAFLLQLCLNPEKWHQYIPTCMATKPVHKLTKAANQC